MASPCPSYAGYRFPADIIHRAVWVQAKRDARAAGKLMRKLLKKQGMAPSEWATDKCPAYGAGHSVI